MPSPAVTLSGTLRGVDGSNSAGSLKITLVNYGVNPPIVGGAEIAAVSTVIQAAADGTWSTALWGNDQVSPLNTYYTVEVYSPAGNPTWQAAYQLNSGTYDLGNLTPLVISTPAAFPFIQGMTAQTAPAHNFLTAVNSSGVFSYARPTYFDLGGADTLTGVDIGAKVNAAIALLGATGGEIYIPAGDYTFSTPINADSTSDITIKGAGGQTGGAQAATRLLYTGTATPVSARSTVGFRFTGIQVAWTNAAFNTAVMDFSHATASDTTMFEVDHCSFYKSGSGALAASILLVDKAISSSIHDNLFSDAQVAILGAQANASYANVISIRNNHFSSTTGSIAQAMIRNLVSGAQVTGNTFEMGTGAGSPIILDTTVQVNPSGIHFSGNWIGDMAAGYSGTLFRLVGNGGGSGCVGIAITGNVIACHASATCTVFAFSGSTAGVSIQGNEISSASTLAAFSGSAGVQIRGNRFNSLGTVLTFTGSNVGVEVVGNGWSVAPGTFLTGTPTSGLLEDSLYSITQYGNATGTGIFVHRDGPTLNAPTIIGTMAAATATLSGKLTSYNGLSTTNNGIAPLVATVDLTNQSAAIALTTMFTAGGSAAGLYRVSYYLATQTTGTAGTLGLKLSWSDGVTTKTLTLPTTANLTVNDQTSVLQGDTIVRLNNSAALQYGTVLTGVTGSPTYHIWLRLEAIV